MPAIAGLTAVLAFAFAILMHCFGWGSGKVNVTLFALIGLLALALFVVWEPARSFVRRDRQ